ncbi:MAG: coenzyme F390 synthetase [Dehalococcoidia bacterium]|nr:MAG: coenzyme F390 synthetase [Dehalococcoidia bacterium]
MDVRIMARLLWLRRQLRRHERWVRPQLEAHQARSLAALRQYAYARSPFYQRFHRGLTDRPLPELPVLTKALAMEHFDELVTDRAIRLRDVEAHLATLQGDERFLGRYWLSATSGSTGRRGLFLSNLAEWITVLASYARANDWGGARAGLTRRMKLAVVSTTTPWHQSARVGATLRSWWVPTLRLDATDPTDSVVERLNVWQPETLVAYASMARLLAGEQLAGRLRISPRVVFTASEVLTDETRRRVTEAWGRAPFNVYAATESAGIASECEHHRMHLFEDLVIAEVVDEHNRPVSTGLYGDKVLVTVLFSRTQPLIRYEMSDSLRLGTGGCACGRPFALLDGIQGRAEDVLHFPAVAGGQAAIHPNVFHRVMEAAPVAEWQVVQEPDGLHVLLAGSADGSLADEQLAATLEHELAAQGIVVPRVMVRRVAAIPRTAAGKAPLISSRLPRQ